MQREIMEAKQTDKIVDQKTLVSALKDGAYYHKRDERERMRQLLQLAV